MKIELIRHGKTKLQQEHRYQGWTDAPLSKEGRKELKAAASVPDLLFVTPLLRTKETAEILFPGIPQMVVPDLQEMNFGTFEGRSFREMKEDREYCAWVEGMCTGQCPGGESKAEFTGRVNKAFLELIAAAVERNADYVAIVAHGGTQMSIMDRYCNDGRGYFSYGTKSGMGYLLEMVFNGTEPELKLLKITDYRRK